MKPVALTIAGSDPSGGAGIQADLKTFHQFGVYGEAAITLITVQNTQRVDRVYCLPPDLVIEQILAVVEDIPPGAAKIGALGNLEILVAVAETAGRFQFPLVLDPVMISKHGASLMSPESRSAFLDKLAPRATLMTPNLHEAEVLTGQVITDVDGMRRAAEQLCRLGSRAVLVKGGHLKGAAVDVLLSDGQFYEYESERVDTPHTHGTGCTYSAAITACLATGHALQDAVSRAKQFITEAIRTNPGLGRGNGPVNHHAR
ncbi:MAG: bifunctional hydroxymethylpyrimidine kinase/phosphomethylpyrimidine kinase [Bryobacteraceae bacterium]